MAISFLAFIDGLQTSTPRQGSSTLQAVRRAYELLGDDLCSICPRRGQLEQPKTDWYYMI